MAIVGSMNGVLSLETSGWSKGAKDAAKDVDGLKSKFKSMTAELNDSFGKRSVLGQSLKLMAGSGALGALSKAGGELKDFTAKLVELKNTKQSTGELTEELMKSLPVLGQFWQAGRNIREVLTGEEAAMKKVNQSWSASVKIMNDATNARLAWRKETRDVLADMQKEQKTAGQQTELAGIDDSTQRAIRAAEIEAQNKLDELYKKTADATHDQTAKNLEAEFKRLNSLPMPKDAAAGKNIVDQMNAIKGKLNVLAVDKKQLLDEQSKTETAIAGETAAKISKIKIDSAKDDAEKAAEIQKQSARTLAADIKKGTERYLKIYEYQRDQLLKNTDDSPYHAAVSTARRSATMVQYSPTVASKMEQLSKSQLTELQSINANIEKAKTMLADDDDGVANF